MNYMLSMKLADEEVGKFHGNVVDGWWYQDEEHAR